MAGIDAPPSIDLKIKPVGNIEADFIFHLPHFPNIQAMIAWLKEDSGIDAKVQNIRSLANIDLPNANDNDLDRIEHAQTIDISALTDHAIYRANRNEILDFDENFETDLQNDIADKSNNSLAAIRADNDYKSRLANKKAREAQRRVILCLNRLDDLLKESRRDSNPDSFGAVTNAVGYLKRHYDQAVNVLSAERKENYARIMGRFDHYNQIVVDHRHLLADLKSAKEDLLTQDVVHPSKAWTAAVKRRTGLGNRYNTMKNELFDSEREPIKDLLRELMNILKSKKSTKRALTEGNDQNGGGGGGPGGDGDGDGGERPAKRRRVDSQKPPAAAAAAPPPAASSSTRKR